MLQTRHTETTPHVEDDRPAVLLVDDEPLNRTAMRRILSALYPYMEVREAANGEDALDLIDDRVVAVISDVAMPRLDGIKMCWSIRNSAFCAPWKDLPVILVSALCYNEEAILSAWAAGTALFLPKPFAPADLVRTLSGATGFQPEQAARPLEVTFSPAAETASARAKPASLPAAPAPRRALPARIQTGGSAR